MDKIEMKTFCIRAFFSLGVALLLALLAPQLAMAGPGHDHGEAAPEATGPALPRFAAESELFELVGVLNGKQITLYLDRAADNSPVTEAQIELEMGGQKFQAAKQGGDEFEVVLPEVPAPGLLQIVATVNAGGDFDLLAGELSIVDDAHSHADEAGHVHSWTEMLPWAAGGAGLLAILAVLAIATVAVRRVMASRQTNSRGSA